jgi:DNA-directed RNA polymerase subunit RPC12/RpoP
MGSGYMSLLGSDGKITCSTCGEKIPFLKVRKHVVKCIGKKNENRN